MIGTVMVGPYRLSLKTELPARPGGGGGVIPSCKLLANPADVAVIMLLMYTTGEKAWVYVLEERPSRECVISMMSVCSRVYV